MRITMIGSGGIVAGPYGEYGKDLDADGFISIEAASRFHVRNPSVRWAAEDLARAQQNLLDVAVVDLAPARLLYPEAADQSHTDALAHATVSVAIAQKHAVAVAAASWAPDNEIAASAVARATAAIGHMTGSSSAAAAAARNDLLHRWPDEDISAERLFRKTGNDSAAWLATTSDTWRGAAYTRGGDDAGREVLPEAVSAWPGAAVQMPGEALDLLVSWGIARPDADLVLAQHTARAARIEVAALDELSRAYVPLEEGAAAKLVELRLRMADGGQLSRPGDRPASQAARAARVAGRFLGNARRSSPARPSEPRPSGPRPRDDPRRGRHR
jgi:hypothetical protein